MKTASLPYPATTLAAPTPAELEAERPDWLAAMAACPQDPRWHAEGDVWTHTKLVWAEAARLADQHALSKRDRATLLWGALLHDVAKPAVTREEQGRVVSPGHSRRGSYLARTILADRGVPFDVREEVCWLTRYHGRPPHLAKQDDPTREVIKTSVACSNRLLHLLALADNRGRTALEDVRPDVDIDLWQLAADEAVCLDGPYPFANDQARVLFFRGALSSLHYEPRSPAGSRVTMLCGLPGAGKDTWIARHAPRDAAVVSLDAMRDELDVDPEDGQGALIQAARERCRIHLREKRPFVFNATNVTTEVRGRWTSLFFDYDAEVELVWLEVPLAESLRRNAARCSGERVPAAVIRRLAAKMEPATLAEAHHYTRVF